MLKVGVTMKKIDIVGSENYTIYATSARESNGALHFSID